MENYALTIKHNKATHRFEVADYLHHNNQHCKYRVFENGDFVASFEPDAELSLHVCQNPGELDTQLLSLLAAEIEGKLPHPPVKHLTGVS